MQRVILANDALFYEVTRLLGEGESVTLGVKGDSMLPFIVGGRDSVVLYKTEVLNKGDIVLAYLADGRYVLHRIITMDGEYVRLMGDGNLYDTEECQKQDIAGIVTEILRNGKYVDCTSPAERCKAKLWILLKPIRRYVLAIYRQIIST